MVATSNSVVYNQSFAFFRFTKIFVNFFPQAPKLTQLIVIFWSAAIAIPIAGILLLILSGRKPTFDLISKSSKLLIYYWSCLMFWTLLLWLLLAAFKVASPFGKSGAALWLMIILIVSLLFARAVKVINNRPYWLALIALFLSQIVLPLFVLSKSGALDEPSKWTMQRKFNEADVVAVAKIADINLGDKTMIFGDYYLKGYVFPDWEDIWKGREILEHLKPEQWGIGLIVPIRGRDLDIRQDERYLVFLQIYRESLIPIMGSPVAFYRVKDDDEKILIPLAHMNFPTEQKLVEDESISLETAKKSLIKSRLPQDAN